jgi:hypothetical protein
LRPPLRFLLFAVLLCAPRTAASQNAAPALTVDPAVGHRVSLRLGGVFAHADLHEAVESGLPLRVRIRVELWQDRIIDQLKGSELWHAVLSYNPLEKSYTLRTRGSPSIEHALSTYQAARTALEAPRTFALQPDRPGRYYFTANIEIETLSLSDLEELERWLQGELRPAVTGDRSVLDAVGEGAKRLLIRGLSLPTRTLDLKTPRFQISNRPH